MNVQVAVLCDAATDDNGKLNLLGAFIFCAASFITRSVGIALAGGLALGLVWEFRKELIGLIRKNRIVVIILVIIVVGVAIFSRQLGLDHYTGVFTKQFAEGVGFADLLKWHFTEWTEIGLNTSIVKWVPYLPPVLAQAGVIILGIAFFSIAMYIIFFRKNTIPFIVKAYLCLYTILMFTWPFYDPRFCVPVLPLLIAAVVQVPVSSRRPLLIRGVAYCFIAFYVLLGIVSIGYITYTSLNKPLFARTQANGVYRNEYETVFFGKPQSDTAKKIDPVIVHVLERYNK